MEVLSLYELNSLVRYSIEHSLPDEFWVQAELSEVRAAANGHCYVEFIQKDQRGNVPVAKARGTIWSGVFRLLKPYFEETAGRPFAAGIKVLVQVSVAFHELYGYSLDVHDIDPAYTLGDMARLRREILRRLEEEGVLSMNKDLPMPVLPQRIAVISSATAAGYGDFSHQLHLNPKGYYFHVELFPAVMQGEQVEESVLAALDAVNARLEEFDVVVIIRGGGAASDLSGFDTYLLAAACAQFPLPIITGIGHERDDTVIDSVANTRVKTPTAAAEFLIGCMDKAAAGLQQLVVRIQTAALSRLEQERRRLEVCRNSITPGAFRCLSEARLELVTRKKDLDSSTDARLLRERHRLELLRQRIADASPRKQLARGYSITLKDGRAVKSASMLHEGDRIETCLHNGRVLSTVSSGFPEPATGCKPPV